MGYRVGHDCAASLSLSPVSLVCLAGRELATPVSKARIWVVDAGRELATPVSKARIWVVDGCRVPTPGPSVTLPPNTPLRICNQAPAPFLRLSSVITDPLPGPLR